MQQRLEARGLSASRREGLGSSVAFASLKADEIDAYVEYTGTLWANEMKRTDIKPPDAMLAETKEWLAREHKITMLGSLGFENAYALAMPRKRAEALGIRTMADLARNAGSLSIASDYEFFGRPEWKALQAAYGLAFRQERTMQPEFMYPAAASGDVDVISAYTSDGRIAQYGLVVITDEKHAIPPYDAILLLAPKRANDAALRDALRPLIGAIDVENMRAANLRANGNDAAAAPDAVARWLWEKLKKP